MKKTFRKILSLLALLLLPILFPIVVVIAALIALITWWKKDLEDVLPRVNPIPNIFSNFEDNFKFSILPQKKTFVEKYFKAPKWWFPYMLRSKICNDMQITDMKKKKNGEVEIKFFVWGHVGSYWAPDETWERPHFTAWKEFLGTVICKEVKEIRQESEPKGQGARLNISKPRFSKYKKLMIVDSKTKKPITVILCKKLYIKDNWIKPEEKK